MMNDSMKILDIVDGLCRSRISRLTIRAERCHWPSHMRREATGGKSSSQPSQEDILVASDYYGTSWSEVEGRH